MTKKQITEFTIFARNLALGSGKILKKGFRCSIEVSYKGRIDPVTEFDLKAERFIVNKIKKKYPQHEILTEEGTATGRKSDFRWVIDPLDGTVNFTHHFPMYCCSVALQYNNQTVAGAVFDPERDELFWSGRGLKSYLNKKVISVSTESNLERALLATGFAYDIGEAKRNNLGLFARMAKKVQGIRRPGSAALDICWLACGRIDGFWELKLQPWDTAAAILILENSGGKLSQIDGCPYSIFDPNLLASNGRLHKRMIQVLTSR